MGVFQRLMPFEQDMVLQYHRQGQFSAVLRILRSHESYRTRENIPEPPMPIRLDDPEFNGLLTHCESVEFDKAA